MSNALFSFLFIFSYLPCFGTFFLVFSVSNFSCATLSFVLSPYTFFFNLASLARNLKLQKYPITNIWYYDIDYPMLTYVQKVA